MKKTEITKFSLKITDIDKDYVTFELATFETVGKSMVLGSAQFADFAVRLAAHVYVDSNLLGKDFGALLGILKNLFHLQLNIFDGEGKSVFTRFREQIGDEREKWLRQEKNE